MKHVKLFENFIDNAIKYELVKDLPRPDDKNTLNYFINTSDIDKIRSIEFALKNSSYELGVNSIKTKNIKSIFWFKDYDKYCYKKWDSEFENETAIKTNTWSEVKFDEYFKPTHEYRGHNLKKFGV
jgi:hypothetical protein